MLSWNRAHLADRTIANYDELGVHVEAAHDAPKGQTRNALQKFRSPAS